MADVGIAIGGGTNVPMKAAGIALMHDDPRLLSEVIGLSHRTSVRIREK